MRSTLFAFVLLLGIGGAAHGAPAVQCTVTEILASNEKKGVDPRLDGLKRKLTTPPLSSYDTFKLLGQQGLAMERQKPLATRVTYGNLTLIFKDKLVSQGGKARLRFGVDLDDKDGHRKVSSVVTLDSGGDIMIGGEPFPGGIYILNLACTAP